VKSDDKIVKYTTCFREHKQRDLPCGKDTCRYWVKAKNIQNCCIIGADNGPHTLQEIGDIFNITRMRVCQIEKSILKKLNSDIDSTA
jgi:hypothetical protein